jgi:hypothetical protein
MKTPTPGCEVYKPLGLPPGEKCQCGAPAEYTVRTMSVRTGKPVEYFACRRDAETFAGIHGVPMPGGLYAEPA